MIRERSLRANSWSSLVASGGVFAVTLAVPAILARSISEPDYKIYATALAFLPLALLLSQSLRACAGSALIVAMQRADGPDVAKAYRRIVLLTLVALLVGGAFAIEMLRTFVPAAAELKDGLLRFGIYSVLLNVSGIALALLITGPATARHDFIPENLLKIFPPAFQLALFLTIYLVSTSDQLWWIFLAVAASPWPLTIWLLACYSKGVREWFGSVRRDNAQQGVPEIANGGALRFLIVSTLSVGWWNLTAYFATSVTIAIVALALPRHIVAFGMAFSLIGVLSGGLNAISSPIASRAASIGIDDVDGRVAAFRRFNTLFVVYILAVAAVVMVVPAKVYELWVGPQYAEQVRYMLLLLVPATIFRLQTMCFTLFVMSVGRQSTLWLSPMLEALAATVGSIVLTSKMGIEGIALALTLSAALRLALTVAYDIKRNQDIFPIRWTDMLISRPARFW